jgi:hypothetical protein
MITVWKTRALLRGRKEAADVQKAQELANDIMSAAHYLATTHMIRRGFDQERYLNCKNMIKALGELPPLSQTLLTSTIHHYKIMFHLY